MLVNVHQTLQCSILLHEIKWGCFHRPVTWNARVKLSRRKIMNKALALFPGFCVVFFFLLYHYLLQFILSLCFKTICKELTSNDWKTQGDTSVHLFSLALKLVKIGSKPCMVVCDISTDFGFPRNLRCSKLLFSILTKTYFWYCCYDFLFRLVS